MAKVAYDGNTVSFDCPGCGHRHAFNVRAAYRGPVWRWNANPDNPTVYGSLRYDGGDWKCHFTIRAGVIQFLRYCTHHLAGRSERMRDE